jgi:hypothetical protein
MMGDKESFLSTLKETRTTIDKELLVLSVAALGFSVHFVEAVGKQEAAKHLLFLVLACWSFGLTIIVTLFSHVSSEHHCTAAFDYISTDAVSDYDKALSLHKKAMKWNRVTVILNCASLLFLATGIILFLLYATCIFMEKI